MSSTESKRGPCLVCDGISIGVNFGVQTCMACKAFFRRNAVRLGSYNFICSKDGDCVITRTKRPMCNCCRLAKCFRLGMKKEWILSEAEKEERRLMIEQNRRRKNEKYRKSTTLDLIQPSRLLPTIYKTSSYLSISDNTTLSNIINAYELSNVIGNCSSYADFPSRTHTSLHTYFNEYSNSYQSLIAYLKRIPEFNTISINDRVRLLKDQFGVVNNINEAIAHPGVTNNLIQSFSNIFGIHIADRLLESIERIQIFTYDPVILKLGLIIVALSSGNYRYSDDTQLDQICDDTLSIFYAQNVYVELLWKYILSRSPSEMDAVKFYSKIIQFLLYLLNVHILVDGYISNLPHEIEKMEPLMQSMWPQSNDML